MRTRIKALAVTLIAAVLAPTVMVLGTAGEAQAAYGQGAQFNIKVGDWDSMINACSGDAYYDGGTGTPASQSVDLPDVSCSNGVAGSIDSYSSGQINVTFDNGSGSGAASCSYTTGWTPTTSAATFKNLKAIGGAGCTVSEVCIQWQTNSTLTDSLLSIVPASSEGSGCSAIQLGAFPTASAPPSACNSLTAVGVPAPPDAAHTYTLQNGSGVQMGQWSLSYTGTGNTPPLASGAVGRWIFYGIYQGDAGNSSGSNDLFDAKAATSGSSAFILSQPLSVNPMQTTPQQLWSTGIIADGANFGTGLFPNYVKLIGVGFYWDGTYGGGYGYPEVYPQADSYGRIGVSDSTKCSFYWGTKVAATGAPTDTPLAPIPTGSAPGASAPTATNPAPAPPSNACTFSITSPSTWASAGVCALVGLMGKLIDAVSGLPGRIASAISGLFMTLFVPHPSSWGWAGFVGQLQARPPTSVAVGLVSEIQGVANGLSNAGSCGTLADFGGGMKLTCSAVKSIPGYAGLEALIQVGLVALTGFSCFHIFRGVLGNEGGN